ncbi:hypothetical protein [Paenibacillus ginsengarvi]|uniref:Uncharacterized protein n=1 Tax=Paenibacillus ginsengarvi TaxID=400777 RepID=A0A3B0CMS5_9BACL|nr:hypothetical protein [Paenibacillus ginsengarvi]RKN86058.1 hypothetical protein D7M11_03330 [Paenibacillus ginsengarvi]
MSNAKEKIVELDVEKINIVDKDGNIRMSLFNSERIPDPVIDGKVVSRSGIPGSGMLFYNNEGDECGGLVFGSKTYTSEDYGGQYAGKTESVASLTFDAYKGDQVTHMYFHESTIGERMYGYVLYDRPSGVARARMDRAQDGAVGVRLSDSKGQERIRLVIDANDVPVLEFLNEKGEVVYSLPPK